MSTVHILDYGIGNLHSVSSAFQTLGIEVKNCKSAKDFVEPKLVVIPGVGAFQDCVEQFATAFGDIVPELIARDITILGICVGMQMLSDYSEEFGHAKGLGVIPGQVVRLPEISNAFTKIPNIGWRQLSVSENTYSIFSGVENGHFYFLHSYYFQTQNSADCIATVDYAGIPITAAVQSGNVIGLQFHPEKSGSDGLAILHNICKKTLL